MRTFKAIAQEIPQSSWASGEQSPCQLSCFVGSLGQSFECVHLKGLPKNRNGHELFHKGLWGPMTSHKLLIFLNGLLDLWIPTVPWVWGSDAFSSPSPKNAMVALTSELIHFHLVLPWHQCWQASTQKPNQTNQKLDQFIGDYWAAVQKPSDQPGLSQFLVHNSWQFQLLCRFSWAPI